MKSDKSRRKPEKEQVVKRVVMVVLMVLLYITLEGSYKYPLMLMVGVVGIYVSRPKELREKKQIEIAKRVASKGLAVITGDLKKDFALLKYVNPEDSVGWLEIEGQTYSPVMRGERYKKENFLKKPSEYGEVVEKDTRYDVIYLEGNSEGKPGDKRFAGFMELESLKHAIGQEKVKYITEEGQQSYRVVGVREISVGELGVERIETTEAFIKRLKEIIGGRGVLKGGGRGIMVLQSKTDIGITLALLEEGEV